MGSVLSKIQTFAIRQWQSLCQNLSLVKLKAYPKGRNDRACGQLCDKNLFLI